MPDLPNYSDLPFEARTALLLLAGGLVLALLVTLNLWLAYEAARRLARQQYRPRVRRVEVPIDRSEHEQALRREVYTMRSRIDDLTGQLNAARQIGRQQERAGLALHTLRAEIEQTQRHPVIRLGGPGRAGDPTLELATVTPLRSRLVSA